MFRRGQYVLQKPWLDTLHNRSLQACLHVEESDVDDINTEMHFDINNMIYDINFRCKD